MRDGWRALAAVCTLVIASVAALPAARGPVPVGNSARWALEVPTAGPQLHPTLVIDPSAWWLESGENVTLSAAWVGEPADCSLTPLWFRWTVTAGGDEGELGATNASSTVFYAVDGGSGTTSVALRGASTLACRGNLSAAFARAIAQVTVAAPVSVRDLSFVTNPIAPNASATITGTLSGGEPPYRVRVDWGDGSTSEVNVSTMGPFSADHPYDEPGSFEPELLVTDAAGRAASTRPEESLEVSAAFAVAIDPSSLVAEAGVPVVFTIRTTEAPGNLSWVFACEDATPAPLANATGLVYGCAFQSPGIAPVEFEAVGAAPPFPFANASMYEPVVAPPSIGFPSPAPVGETGHLVYAPFEIEGGVPPFIVDWSLVGAGTAGVMPVSGDGVGYLPLTSTVAGALLLSVVVTDALGVASAYAEELTDVAPELLVQAAVAADLASAELLDVNVSGSAVEGCPPFDWSVVPNVAAMNGSAPAGTLGGVGPFSWNASFSTDDAVSLIVVVVDAAGVSVSVNLTEAPVPYGPPAGSATGTSSVGVGWAVAATGLIAVAIGAAYILHRRRTPRPIPVPPDPVAVLRAAIEPSDGVDRGLVETLAEERGVPAEVVRETLERLKADGRVRSGRGTDGEEVLAWSRPYEP